MNYLMNEIRTERLKFRLLKNDDFEALLPYFLDEEWGKYLKPTYDSAEENCNYLIETVHRRYKDLNGLMALEHLETSQLAGLCGLLKQEVDHRQVIEIGYHLLPDYRGKGYATEAAVKCKEHAFEKKLTPCVVSLIHEQNTNSVRVAENNGMYLEKKSVWRDYPILIYRADSGL